MQDHRFLGIENDCKYITTRPETQKVNNFFFIIDDDVIFSDNYEF